jgi:hypothetical protein
MSFLIPRTTYDFVVDFEMNLVFTSLKENLIGERPFNIKTLFGTKDVNYYGEFKENQIYLTRKIDSLNKIPIYPSSRIIFLSNENQKMIKVECSLSVYWRVFIYSIYLFLLIGLVLGWFHSASLQSKILLLNKIFGSILILNMVILGYHFSEVRNIKKIILGIVNRYN